MACQLIEPLFDQTIGETRHRNPLVLCAMIKPRREVMPVRGEYHCGRGIIDAELSDALRQNHITRVAVSFHVGVRMSTIWTAKLDVSVVAAPRGPSWPDRLGAGVMNGEAALRIRRLLSPSEWMIKHSRADRRGIRESGSPPTVRGNRHTFDIAILREFADAC
jgi:hypothetical protein